MDLPIQNINQLQGRTKAETLENIKREIKKIDDVISRYRRMGEEIARIREQNIIRGNLGALRNHEAQLDRVYQVLANLPDKKKKLETYKRKLEHFQMLTKGKVSGKGRKKKPTQKKTKTKK